MPGFYRNQLSDTPLLPPIPPWFKSNRILSIEDDNQESSTTSQINRYHVDEILDAADKEIYYNNEIHRNDDAITEKTIYLIRHGESEYNLHYEKFGTDPMIFDATLTPQGEEQAKEIAKR